MALIIGPAAGRIDDKLRPDPWFPAGYKSHREELPKSAGSMPSERQCDPEHLHRIERKLCIEAALDVVGRAETVLLTREQEVADSIAIAPQRLDHDLGLVRRHYGVLGALEENHRLRQPIGVIDRRSLAIALLHFGKRSDEPVEISRLELMGVT